MNGRGDLVLYVWWILVAAWALVVVGALGVCVVHWFQTILPYVHLTRARMVVGAMAASAMILLYTGQRLHTITPYLAQGLLWLALTAFLTVGIVVGIEALTGWDLARRYGPKSFKSIWKS